MVPFKEPFTSQEHFEFYRERYDQWRDEHDFEGGDPGIIPFLKKFSECDGLAPAWSCESHSENEETDFFYMAFAVKDEGAVGFLVNVYDRVCELVKEKLGVCFLEISVGYLFSLTGDGIWRRWSIEAHLNVHDKPIYMAAFTQALEEIPAPVGEPV